MSPLLISTWFDLSLLAAALSILPLIVLTIKGGGGRRRRRRRRTSSSSNEFHLPPSPPSLPLLGNLHQLGSLPHRSLRDLANEYGPLLLINMGQVPTLIASSAEAAQEILRTYDHIFASRPTLLAPRIIAGDVFAFLPYGDHWKQARKLCVTHLLSMKMVRSFHLVREEEVAAMTSKISESTGVVLNMSKVVSSYAYNVLCRAVSERCFQGGRWRDAILEQIRGNATLLCQFSVGDFFPALGWLGEHFGLGVRAKKQFSGWDRVLDEIICEHEDTAIDDSEGRHDFVNVLLALQKESKSSDDMLLTREVMKGILQDIFAAGTDTTSVALDWAMSELIHNPNLMKKLQDEVRSIASTETTVTEEDCNKMSYLKAVIKETLRLHPPVPLLLPRESMDHCKIRGYDVPDKTRVIVNAWAINRDPKYWEAPDKFQPERFLSGGDVDFRGQDLQFIPFGAGRRICPGLQFSVPNMELALANLVGRFDWALPDGMRSEDMDMSDSPGLTTHRRENLRLVAKPFVAEKITET